ncbi:hypothetical protein ES332_D06G101500v1 [Gossypium tomentosum]|uniref:Uncharacterized protein n=1 Tax=Gossypium tomentosum TaxID=34277 RepID=A0A5D2KHL4_GOSTO|nr:hypothetical protein ES332_D06G101500v1 [Gossypium tomentosum]TYH66126.1 hypothetical protein ES332_D06G101500v1 [Gossypium tomentosum]
MATPPPRQRRIRRRCIGRLCLGHRLEVRSFCHWCIIHNIVIPLCRWCCKHLRDYFSTKVKHLCNHLFLEQRIYDGNQEATNHKQLWMKAKKMQGRDHNIYLKRPVFSLNQEKIQLAIIDHPDVAHILTDDWIDFFVLLM